MRLKAVLSQLLLSLLVQSGIKPANVPNGTLHVLPDLIRTTMKVKPATKATPLELEQELRISSEMIACNLIASEFNRQLKADNLVDIQIQYRIQKLRDSIAEQQCELNNLIRGELIRIVTSSFISSNE